ncbi:MAG: DUF4026 domain-containing protein [Myxococcota bacterium]
MRFEGRVHEVWMEATTRDGFDVHVRTGAIDADRAAIAEDSDFCIVVATAFAERPLWEYHSQLRLLAAVAKDCALVIDDNACTPYEPSWLFEAARSQTPPSPKRLYAVHCVVDNDRVWAHTHGLRRCGSIEIEMLDVPKTSIQCLAPLLHAVAAQWIELGPPDADEPFVPGRDMELVWIPWRKALGRSKPRGPGGMDDRDAAHAGESGVLKVPTDSWTGRKLCCPSRLTPNLERNPMLYLSNMETVRMALLAAERLPRFAALFARKGGHPDWRFLVKLGYPVDGGDDEQREHLWFDVHGLDGADVDATLLNEPYHVARLHCGDRGPHSLEKLSDWTVISPFGQFGPDAIHRLEETIDAHH